MDADYTKTEKCLQKLQMNLMSASKMNLSMFKNLRRCYLNTFCRKAAARFAISEHDIKIFTIFGIDQQTINQ